MSRIDDLRASALQKAVEPDKKLPIDNVRKLPGIRRSGGI